MKRTLYTVLGDWNSDERQVILYQGFKKKLALQAALEYFIKHEGPDTETGFFKDDKRLNFDKTLKKYGVEKFLDRFADSYWNYGATILKRKVEV